MESTERREQSVRGLSSKSSTAKKTSSPKTIFSMRIPLTPRKEPTAGERQAVWELLLLRSDNGKLAYGQQSEIAQELNIHRKTVERIWRRGRQSMGVRIAAIVQSRRHQRGRKKKDRGELCQRIREIPMAQRTNQLKLQLATGASCWMVEQLLKEGYMRRALKQTCPLLTNEHKIARLKFCVSHVIQMPNCSYRFDEMFDVVHIDEKRFYVKNFFF